MKYQVTMSHAFEETVSAIFEDAAFHGKVPGDEYYDEYLARLSKVALAPVIKTTKAGITLELDADGLAVLREEATYRVEWASDEASAEWGAERMRWFGVVQSAKAMINRIDKAVN